MTNSKKPNLRLVTDDDIPEAVEDDGIDPTVVFTAPSEAGFWYDFNEFVEIDKVREYIIKGWLIAHGVTAFLARRGTGKSTIALDLGCHLACDMDWWGTPAMTGWCVIYICGEDDEGMILNCRAWAQEHGKAPEPDRFRIARGIIKMTDGPELEHRVKEMVAWANGRRCIVILDTWQRAVSGANTVSQEEMDIAVQNAERVAKAVNGPMIACYHPPKGAKELTIRGSAVQEDTSSGIWFLEKKEDGVLVTIARAKGSGEGNWRKFRFKKITLPGEDAFGDPLEGIVPEQFSGAQHDAITWLANQRKAAEVIQNEQAAYAYQIWQLVSSDPGKNWTVGTVADALKGVSITAESGERIDIPGLTQATAKLNSLFAHPVELPGDGVVIRLVSTGKAGPGGVAVRVFQVEKTTPNTGESNKFPDNLG